MDIEAKIRELEEELRRTPYNKATQHHIGLLKAKIAKLKEQLEKREAKKGTSGKAFAVKKHGDATVVMLGPPSVGKSTLLNALTNAESEVGEYAFTTLQVIPGMLEYKGARIQLVDIPGIIGGAHAGRGRGREVLSVARIADLLLLMGETPEQIEEIEKELYNAGIRINTNPPDVVIKKKDRGGIDVVFAVKQSELDERLVKDMLREYGYHNAEILIREYISIDQLIDVLRSNSRRYIRAIRVITKSDKLNESDRKRIREKMPDVIFISAEKGEGLEELKEKIYQELGLIRVYTKKVGEEPKYDEPLILKKGAKVMDACKKIHKDFVKNFQFARIWGKSVKFPGQRVGLEHELKDGDVLELHIRR